ncbi:TIGR04086 family membrane protein [Gemmiger sp.]
MSEKNRRRPKPTGKNPAAAALLLAFGCGVGACILLMALGAFLLTHTNLPLSAVRPIACLAAALGAALSASVLARRLKEKLLLCGLGCGVFYTACLLAASLLANGGLDLQGSNTMLPAALLMGGLLGGAVSALRANR